MLVHQQDHLGVRYEVRTAGASRRLYTNGAFHSQYNPRHLFTGAVWDLLSLPSLFMMKAPRRVLVLGVGGGTVIHQLNQLHPLKNVVGIELDPVHIDIARNHFDLNYPHTSLILADGKSWLSESTECFDYIVDDIFLHTAADPMRPHAPDREWFDQLLAHLAPGGAIVQNHISRRDARRASNTVRSSLRVLPFETQMYENCVIACFDDQSSASRIRRRGLQRIDAMPRRITGRLRASF